MKSTITTSGSGSVSAIPDSLLLRVSVDATKPSVSDALDAVASGVSATGEVARDYVEDTDITSTGLTVFPDYDNQGNQRGNRASHGLTLRCKDLDKAGQLIAAVGALLDRVTICGMDLAITDPAPLQVQARAAAFADARAKADELAGLAGVRITKAVRIAEGGGGVSPVGVREVAMKAMADSMPIEAGTQSVSASLAVTWAVRDRK